MALNEENVKKAGIFFKLFLLIFILVAVPAYLYFFQRDFLAEFSSVEDIEEFLFAHERTGVFIYIGAQILQIIICVIPGQPFQFAAGYVFGVWHALIYSLVGIIIGATMTFFLAKLLGRDAIYLLFGKKKVLEYLDKFSTKRGYFVLFIMYFIPGFPKDFVNYVAGLSKLKWGPFIIISSLARLPAMMGSILVGTFTEDRNFVMVAVVVVVVGIITFCCIRHKEQIIKWGDKIYDKLNGMKY